MLALVFPALAQDVPNPPVNAQLYRLPVDAAATLWTDDATVSPGLGARLGAGWVHDPFVWVWEDTGEKVSVVGDAVGLDAIGSYGFWRLRAAVDVPFYPVATGDVASGGGLGDLAIDVKGSVLDPEDAPVGLAIAARLSLPTATVALPLGNDGVGWEAVAIADKPLGDLRLAANLGVRGMPHVQLENVDVSEELIFRVGGGYAIGDKAGVSLDVAGQATLAELSNPAGLAAEALVGGWYHVSEPLSLRAGVGRGLARGPGSPGARAVLALAWQAPAAPKAPRPKPEAAAEPVKPAPAKPTPPAKPAPAAEPAATTKAASAAKAAEPANVIVVPGGTADLAPGIVHLKITDPNGTPVDAIVTFGDTRPVEVPAGRGMAKVPPGTWTITVASPTLGTRAVTLEVESGLTSALDLVLQPALVVVGKDKLDLREKLRFDGTTLLPENGVILDEVVAVLKAHPEITGVRIEGHTDSRGSAEDNLTRSGARAAAVMNYLVERGIDPERLVVAGYGESRPIDWADTPAAWEKNDRIEFVISARAE